MLNLGRKFINTYLKEYYIGSNVFFANGEIGELSQGKLVKIEVVKERFVSESNQCVVRLKYSIASDSNPFGEDYDCDCNIRCGLFNNYKIHIQMICGFEIFFSKEQANTKHKAEIIKQLDRSKQNTERLENILKTIN